MKVKVIDIHFYSKFDHILKSNIFFSKMKWMCAWYILDLGLKQRNKIININIWKYVLCIHIIAFEHKFRVLISFMWIWKLKKANKKKRIRKRRMVTGWAKIHILSPPSRPHPLDPIRHFSRTGPISPSFLSATQTVSTRASRDVCAWAHLDNPTSRTLPRLHWRHGPANMQLSITARAHELSHCHVGPSGRRHPRLPHCIATTRGVLNPVKSTV
jgi:hypothetical protein